MDALVPDASRCGAATTTSHPALMAAAARCRKPGLSIPSSFVTTACGATPSPTTRDRPWPQPVAASLAAPAAAT
jgi:hypothetical protein